MEWDLGSFTGIRIGISTVKGIRGALNIPVIGVPTLLSIAFNKEISNKLICSIIDAKHDNVYYALFDSNYNLVFEYSTGNINNVLENILKISNGSEVMFAGDAVNVHKEKIIKNGFLVAEEEFNLVSAFSTGKAGYNLFKENNVLPVIPMYLRPSNAERTDNIVDKKNIEIYKMTLEDLNLISNILHTEFDDFWTVENFKTELNNENSTYFVAKFKNKIVGFCGLWDSSYDIHITNIVIKKDFRNLGIASFLLEKMIEAAKHENKDLTLEVNETNFIAQKLYTKYGFEKLGTRKNYYKSNNAIIMTLNLQGGNTNEKK